MNNNWQNILPIKLLFRFNISGKSGSTKMPFESHRRSIIWYLTVLILLCASILSIIRIVSNTMKTSGGIDSHAYWYSGHFLRQGKDPYGAFINREEPELPVIYLDRRMASELPIAQEGLSRTPANTMTMVSLLSLLSFFSWPAAKTIWMVINLALMIVVPLLTVNLLPQPLGKGYVAITCLIFIAMQGTRVAVWVGQTTLFVFALMLGSLLLLNRGSILSGIMLGLALSKFSIAFPVFLFIAYRRRYLVLAISLLIQLGGLLFVSLSGHRSPVAVVDDYLQILIRHTDLPGIHLMSLFDNPLVPMLLVLFVGSAILFFFLWRWMPKAGVDQIKESRLTFREYHGLVALLLWALLATYHRVYDTALVIAFVALLIFGQVHRHLWNLTERGQKLVFSFLIIFLVTMMLPGSIMGIVLPDSMLETWLQIVSAIMTLALLSALFLVLILLHRLQKQDKASQLKRDSTLAQES